MITLNQAGKAVSARDPKLLRPLLRPYGNFTVMEEKADGSRLLSSGDWDAYLKTLKAGPEEYQEQLLEVRIRRDGEVADVRAPYVFWVDGKLSHCGVNHYQLVFDEGLWKIQNLLWTQRVTGCSQK
jgi:hypothetical protein